MGSLNEMVMLMLMVVTAVLMSITVTTADSYTDPGSTLPDTSGSMPPRSPTDAWLSGQNNERAMVGVPPLVWDTKLEKYATSWANERRGDCDLRHSNGPYGENLFWGSGTDWQPNDAVETWLTEKKCYNAASNSCNESEDYGGNDGCGHYTQIVWRSTTSVGCARMVCSDNNQVFMICSYSPPGNYIGERPY